MRNAQEYSKRLMIAFIALWAIVFAGPALACTVCGFGQDGTQFAFILTTGILTFVPLILIGGISYAIYRRVRQHEQDTQTITGH